ncbi:Bromodomain-containing protein, partial [Ramicandelaber brevisporus]
MRPTRTPNQSQQPRTKRTAPDLPLAVPPPPREPTEEERRLLRAHDEYIFRELRITLRTILDELFKERKFRPFSKPVDAEDVPDYYDVVAHPMDLSTMLSRVNSRYYLTADEFLADIDMIPAAAREYHG